MMILNSIVSTINVAIIISFFFAWRIEQEKVNRCVFEFLMFLLAVNTALIWS